MTKSKLNLKIKSLIKLNPKRNKRVKVETELSLFDKIHQSSKSSFNNVKSILSLNYK